MKYVTTGKENMTMVEENPEPLIMKYALNAKYSPIHGCRKRVKFFTKTFY